MFSALAARRLRLASRIAYVVVVLLATLTNLNFDPDPARVAERLQRALHWALNGSDVVDAARNVALFAGFGVVWIVTSPPEHPWRQTARITLLGFLLSLGVEVVQLASASRMSSINDVATNTAGALTGALAIVTIVSVLHHVRPVRTHLIFPFFPMAGAYMGAVAAEMFAPFWWRERMPGTGGSIADRLVYALQHVLGATPESISLFDLVAFSPAGAMAVLALAELGLSYGAACWLTVLGGFALAATMEIAHGIAGQPIVIGAIVSHTLGIALGAVIAWRGTSGAMRRIPSRRARARLLLAAYAILLAFWTWRPFVVRWDTQVILDQLTLAHLTPLGLMSGEVDLFGVMDLVRQFCLFLPLGSLLAVWPLTRHGRLAYVLPAIYLSIALELGQLLVIGRTFDVTDVLTQCAAIGVGLVVVRRAGWGVLGEVLEEDPGEQGDGLRRARVRANHVTRVGAR